MPYNDINTGITVSTTCGKIVFTTEFGLTVTWDGNSASTQTISDGYGGFICGLCGNGDGKKENDYVDRENKPVELKGNKYTKFFNWGSKWRTLDDSADTDQKL